MAVEASEIVPRLWQGSKPQFGPYVANRGYDLLVLCAREYQPPADSFPGVRVIHAPNDDKPELYPFTTESLRTAVQASGEVAQAYQEGQRVLITCAAGINRSGLVMALSLHRLFGWSGKVCIGKIRKKRPRSRYGTLPLSNTDFTKVLRNLRGQVELPGLGLVSL